MEEDRVAERFELLDQRLEVIDKIQAQLMTGLGELWSGLEALAGVVLDNQPEEKRAQFAEGLKLYQSQLWKAVSDSIARTVERAAGESDPGDAPGGSDAAPRPSQDQDAG